MKNLLISFVFIMLSFLDSTSQIDTPKSIEMKGVEAANYCKEHSLNTDFCILIDMSIHSGKNRLFIYQFSDHSIISAGLCAHGCCDGPWGADESKTNPIFSNVSESHCSSIGKFKIGKRGYSSWGIHVNYKLHGLEATNDNAFDRFIVLHSWEMVSDSECFPDGTPEGWGCPAVSNNQMKTIDRLLQKTNEPVLMWIY